MLCDNKELAKELSIPVSTVDYLRRKGKITPIWVGKHARYDKGKTIKEFTDRSINS